LLHAVVVEGNRRRHILLHLRKLLMELRGVDLLNDVDSHVVIKQSG
jgi:hypothetical protein